MQCLNPPLPPLPPLDNASSPIPIGKVLLRGAIHREPAVRQTCCIWGIWVRFSFPTPVSHLCPAHGGDYSVRQTYCIWGIWVRVSFPSPVSQLCPTRGGAKREPGGWSNYCHPPPSMHIFVHFPPPYPHHTLFQFISIPNFSSIIVTHHTSS